MLEDITVFHKNRASFFGKYPVIFNVET